MKDFLLQLLKLLILVFFFKFIFKVLELYSSVIGKSEKVDKYFRLLRKSINNEIFVQEQLCSLKGILDTLMIQSKIKN
jgi:hypothetical protein